MDENRTTPWEGGGYEPPKTVLPMGRRELLYAAGVLILSMLLCNSLIYHGANLGFGLSSCALVGASWLYLRKKGSRYASVLLALCMVIAAGFARSDDGVLKFLSACLLLTVPSLALCLMAGKNRRDPAGVTSLLDSPRTLFGLGFGHMAESGRGIKAACQSSGTIGRTGGAVILGVVIAVPVVAVLVPLLMFADAAFEGLMDLLPEFRVDEALVTVTLGAALAFLLYTRSAALRHLPGADGVPKTRKGINAVTVNTVLIAVAVVYLVYLASQLAYFVGGFAGLLPEGYTMAQYARRGFFEMAWLCSINLGVVALSMGLVSAKGPAPRLTKVLCLFLGAVTLFLVATASAKMFLYIGSYGLTRRRVLTEVFMLWLAAVTVTVCVWLFRPKTPYMKAAMVLALALCAGLLWADVDAQVARYNVRAYQSGRLETVDVSHLRELGYGAVPYLEELTADADPEVAEKAVSILTRKANKLLTEEEGLLDWNGSEAKARKVLEKYFEEPAAEVAEVEDTDVLSVIGNDLNVALTGGTVLYFEDSSGGFHGDGEVFGEIRMDKYFDGMLQRMSGWNPLPLTENLSEIVYGGGFLEQEIPEIGEGWYYFWDRHLTSTSPKDDSDIFSRASYNFTLAIFDSETDTLYYYKLDT